MHTATLYALRFKLTCWDVQILVGSGSALYAACKWTFMHLANFAFSLILIYLFWEFKDSDPQPRTNWPWSRQIWYEDFRSWTQLSVVPFCLFVLNLWNIRKIKSLCGFHQFIWSSNNLRSNWTIEKYFLQHWPIHWEVNWEEQEKSTLARHLLLCAEKRLHPVHPSNQMLPLATLLFIFITMATVAPVCLVSCLAVWQTRDPSLSFNCKIAIVQFLTIPFCKFETFCLTSGWPINAPK